LPVGKDCAGGIIAKIDGKKAKLDLTSTAIINNCQNYTDIYINISAYGKAGGIAAYVNNGI
jgi:vacuolar-type H+-ATPase subunit E/Vma4